MERIIKYLLRTFVLLFVVTLLWGIFITPVNSASPEGNYIQITPPDTTLPEGDLPYPIPSGQPGEMTSPAEDNKLFLGTPSNFKDEVIYDPVTNTYTFTKKAGDINLSSPWSYTTDEYKELNL